MSPASPKVIDSSLFNRRKPSPDLLKLAGVWKIILEGTDGFGWANAYFPYSVRQYLNAGIEVEALHAWYGKPDPDLQLETLDSFLSGVGWDKARTVWIDCEDPRVLPWPLCPNAPGSIWRVASGARSLGYSVGIYTRKSWWDPRIGRDSHPWSLFKLFVAQWNDGPAPTLIPAQWRGHYDLWQYAGDQPFLDASDGIDFDKTP